MGLVLHLYLICDSSSIIYLWQAAENLLISLGALAVEQVPRPLSRRGRRKPPDVVSRITPLGRAMACFPVSPRYAKMLSLGHQQGLLPYVVAVVAALSVQEVFIEFHKSSEDVSTSWCEVNSTPFLSSWYDHEYYRQQIFGLIFL